MEIIDSSTPNTVSSSNKYLGSPLSGARAAPGYPKNKANGLQDQGPNLAALQPGMPETAVELVAAKIFRK
jgi:hypothetical protein